MKTPVSPKVLWPVFTGYLLASLLANFNLITPDMLSALGPWAPYVLGTLFVALQFGTGYFKTDPLRTLGAETAARQAAVLSGPHDTPAPAPVPAPEVPAAVPVTAAPVAPSQAAPTAPAPITLP